jgi:hypothetical protein
MLAWRELAAYYADATELEKLRTPQLKCTIAEDLVCLDTSVQSFPFVLSITDLEMPVFTSLGLKSSLLIGGIHKRISLIKLENF